MVPLSKLVAAIVAYFQRDEQRWDELTHCEHQAAGACSPECEDIVRAERW